METGLPNLAEIRQAADLIYKTMPATPQYAWPLLSQRAGAEVWVKHENHSPVGAFKLRGGLVYMDWLKRERPEVTTVVSATRGNHGQSIALAATRNGIRAVLVVPYRCRARTMGPVTMLSVHPAFTHVNIEGHTK